MKGGQAEKLRLAKLVQLNIIHEDTGESLLSLNSSNLHHRKALSKPWRLRWKERSPREDV